MLKSAPKLTALIPVLLIPYYYSLSSNVFSIFYLQVDTLYAGEVGYLAAQIKSVQDARVGDTVTLKKAPAPAPLDGYEDVQPMVYCGLFPTDADDYQVRLYRC
jgi:translation elongation factor EF-4